ncbi:hypothetical protein Patl1_34705 [Pistacia atlantica]|uniref:Uncharacterized protein n=1 Tax=Pistacia atlantica TaxID=434234 RepID=A0ACC0ZUE1_9ROSI|nr:hypothetical protein Patl1_34705 [Pistacia atlantica]
MAGLLRSLKRSQLLYNSILLNTTKQNKALFISNLNPISQTTTRNYMGEMRKAAFQDKILRLLRNEIEYELERFPPKQAQCGVRNGLGGILGVTSPMFKSMICT